MLYVHVVTSATHKLVNQYQLQLQYQGKKSFFFLQEQEHLTNEREI